MFIEYIAQGLWSDNVESSTSSPMQLFADVPILSYIF